jgi:hypothetical protein
METLTIEQFHQRLKAQGVTSREHVALKCPICGTVQSIASLKAAGASDEVAERSIGWSCEGRLTHVGPAAARDAKDAKSIARRKVRGCDWTLGGLLKLHEMEVIDEDGERHPRFVVATPDEARQLEQQLGG